MSWNRKDWLKLAGLLGLGATGLGAAGVGPLAGLLGSNAAAAPGVAGAVVGEGAIPMSAMGGNAAIQASQAATTMGQALTALGGAADATNKVGRAYGAVQAGAGLLGGQPEPPPSPPPQAAPFQAAPVSQPYGADMPPPGIDPRQWAMMTPEQKRMFRGMR